jgi:hypothetical protein
VSGRYIGFYWTLPVTWAGFTSLSKSADEAARQSWTIRYQRTRVKEWLSPSDALLREEVFLEARSDAGTRFIQPALDALRRECIAQQATLLAVDFSQQMGWRSHHFMERFVDRCFAVSGNSASGLPKAIMLEPSPVTDPLTGDKMDPAAHFRRWRDRSSQSLDAFEDEANTHLGALLIETTGLRGRWTAIANTLNQRQVKTAKGKPWTPDNVRKFAKDRGFLEPLTPE